jgi:RNA polymerase sigma-70 factor (ECF subfamily)
MSEQTSTEILVSRAQQGDRDAYGDLFVCFYPTVYVIALVLLRNPTEAEELAQDVFVHGMEKLPQLRDPRCFPGWLRMMTTRMAIKAIKCKKEKCAQRLDSLTVEQELDTLAVDPFADTDNDCFAAVREAFNGLPRDQQALVTYCIIDKHSNRQAAERFQVSLGVVVSKLRSARKMMEFVLNNSLTRLRCASVSSASM